MRERIRRWWNAWLTRTLEPVQPGGFPQAVYRVNWRHPRARLVHLVTRDPVGYVRDAARARERAYRRRGYVGEW